jgi:imidazoleglycerol phosphate synthase glutamine amidotransferase subunit HisH
LFQRRQDRWVIPGVGVLRSADRALKETLFPTSLARAMAASRLNKA